MSGAARQLLEPADFLVVHPSGDNRAQEAVGDSGFVVTERPRRLEYPGARIRQTL